MLNNIEILVQRNNSLYRADFNSLSSIVLFLSEKQEFLGYLDELSTSLESLNNSIDMVLYSKENAKSNLTTVETLSNLNSDGNLVTKTMANDKAGTLVSKQKIYKKNDNDCWYQVQWGSCADNIRTGYHHSRHMVVQELGSDIGGLIKGELSKEDAVSKFAAGNL